MILIHVQSRLQELPEALTKVSETFDFIFDIVHQLAVPFFLMAAGYFFGRSPLNGAPLKIREILELT